MITYKRPHIDEDLLIPTDDEREEYSEDETKTSGIPSRNIRKVIFPKLGLHSNHYYDMIDWETELKTEPPLSPSLTDDEVLHTRKKPLNVPKWP